MKTTYVLEDASDYATVLGYFSRLSDAKAEAKRYGVGYITKLVGPYKGEGIHIYKLELKDNKFTYKFRR